MKVSLTGGSYQSRSVVASHQRCLNLYPEGVDQSEGEPNPVIYLPTPGITMLANLPVNKPTRGLFTASNGDLFCVCGYEVYYLDRNFTPTHLGTMEVTATVNPVKMADNGLNLILVDGINGYKLDLASKSGFAKIVQDGWYGSTFIDYSDTFFIANKPNTPIFYISDSLSTTFDTLQFASKSGFPDGIHGAIVSHRYIWLIGNYSTEIWYNSASDFSGVTVPTNTFPYSTAPGVEILWGCAATYSIAKSESNIIWLAQNMQGEAVVIMGSGNAVTRVSTHAIEHEFRTYPRIDDASAFTYMQEGHIFYVLNFPTANKTWVYDLVTKLWHERCWLDANGIENRHRAGDHAFAYGKNVIADWELSVLWAYDLDVFNDYGRAIKRLRSFPQITDKQSNARVTHQSFIADLDVGDSKHPENTEYVSLRWSDTKGASWGNPVLQEFAGTGNYLANLKWNRLGMARDRVYELEWNIDALVALAGAYVEPSASNT